MKKWMAIVFFGVAGITHAQSFDNFSNFQIVGGRVFWQNVYQVTDMSRDSVSRLIVGAFKTDNNFKLISSSDDEVIFEVVDKALSKTRIKYGGKVIFQNKDGKCRVTFSSITGSRSRVSTYRYRSIGQPRYFTSIKYFDDYLIDHNKKYFRSGKLQYMTKLNGKFYDVFDFRNRGLGNLLKTNW